MTDKICATLARLGACGLAACLLLTGCGQRGPLTLPAETLELQEQSEDSEQNDEQEEEQD